MRIPAAILLTMLVATPAMAIDIVSGSGAVVKNGAGLAVVNGARCTDLTSAACHDNDTDDRQQGTDVGTADVGTADVETGPNTGMNHDGYGVYEKAQ